MNAASPDFCPNCHGMEFDHKEHRQIQVYRGEEFAIESPAYVCKNCGLALLRDPDLRALRKVTLDAYRAKHGLLTSIEIKSRRERLGLSQDAFAKMLKVGVASVKRWELGTLVQNRAYDDAIRSKTEIASVWGGASSCHHVGQWMGALAEKSIVLTVIHFESGSFRTEFLATEDVEEFSFSRDYTNLLLKSDDFLDEAEELTNSVEKHYACAS